MSSILAMQLGSVCAAALHRQTRLADDLVKQAELDPLMLRGLGVLTPEELQDLKRYEEQLERKRQKNVRNALWSIPIFGVGLPVLKHLLSHVGLSSRQRPWSDLPYSIVLHSLGHLPLAYLVWYRLANWLDRKQTPIPPSLQRYTREAIEKKLSNPLFVRADDSG